MEQKQEEEEEHGDQEEEEQQDDQEEGGSREHKKSILGRQYYSAINVIFVKAKLKIFLNQKLKKIWNRSLLFKCMVEWLDVVKVMD